MTAVDRATAGQREGAVAAADRSPATGRGLGLKREVSTYLGEIDAREINSIPIGVGSDGQDIVARVGRYGPYLQRGEDRVSIPEDLAPDELTVERAEALLEAPSSDRVLGEDPETGLPVQVRAGRFGPYVQLGELVEGGPKPRTSSLFGYMSPATITFEQALDLLRIPRVVGTDPQTGEEIVAHNGKFGPYLKTGHRHPQPGQRGPDPVGRPWTRPWPCSPSPRPAADAMPRARSARWGPIPTPGWPWWSRTVASVPM